MCPLISLMYYFATSSLPLTENRLQNCICNREKKAFLMSD